jgi:hypothetical protein
MARLFQRELATASSPIVPFLRFYRQRCVVEPVELEAGLRRFLALAKG